MKTQWRFFFLVVLSLTLTCLAPVDLTAHEGEDHAAEQQQSGGRVLGRISFPTTTNSSEAQQAFMLHRYKGLTYDKIELSMGISKRRVRHYISSALVKFRVALKGYI